jgi:hypothetical protein
MVISSLDVAVTTINKMSRIVYVQHEYAQQSLEKIIAPDSTIFGCGCEAVGGLSGKQKHQSARLFSTPRRCYM